MAIQFIESWKTYANAADMRRRWLFQSGNGGVVTADGCFLDGAQFSCCNVHVHPLNTIRVGFQITVQAFPAQEAAFLHLCGAGETSSENQVGLSLDPSGRVSAFRGNGVAAPGGAILGTTAQALPLGTPCWVEVDVKLRRSAAGSVEVRLDGDVALLLDGIDTNPQIADWVNVVSLVADRGGKHEVGALYVGDGAEGWLGACSAYRLLLAADTMQADFAVEGAASGFAALNDLANAATRVLHALPGAGSLYALAPPGAAAAIHAVQVRALAVQTALLRDKALVPILKQGGATTVQGAVVPRPAGALEWFDEAAAVMRFAPDGMAWTASALAQAQVGFHIPTFARGFNFRATEAFVTDADYNTHVTGDLYPTTRNGVTFGWDAAPGTLDRTKSSDIYAGINFCFAEGQQRTFRLDLPSPGRYQVRLLLGDASFHHDVVYAQVKDGNRVLYTIDSRVGDPFSPRGGHGLDASGRNNNYALAAWAEYNDARVIVMAGTALNITIAPPAAVPSHPATCLCHLEAVLLDAPLASPMPYAPPSLDLPHRFWRLSGKATGGYVTAEDVRLFEAGNATNLATDRARASSSSTFGPTYSAGKAVAGDSGYWCSAATTATQWWQYDFGSGDARAITRIVLQACDDGIPQTTFSRFRVEWSDDGISYTNLGEFNSTGWAALETRTFDLGGLQPGLEVNGLLVEVLTSAADAAAPARSQCFVMA